MTIYTAPIDEFDGNIDDFDHITIGECEVTPDMFDYDLPADALEAQTDRIMQELEVALVEAYVTDAVAVDVAWYHMVGDRTRVFDVKTWYDGPPEEPDVFEDRHVSHIERYDLTQTSQEEFEEAMEQSDIEFGAVAAYLSKLE